jgi:hypothetical protein
LKEILPKIEGFCFIVVSKDEVDAMKAQYGTCGRDLYFVDVEFIFLSLLRQSLCTDDTTCVY